MQQRLTKERIAGLFLVFLVYASANIFMKLASVEGVSYIAILYMAGAIGVLGVYACLWQRILKVVPLSTAFMFKSITVLYGMLFAVTLFGESISLKNLLGAGLIVLGIIILGWQK